MTGLAACGPADRPEVEEALTRWQAAELTAQLARGRVEEVVEALQLLAAAGRLVDLAGCLLVQAVAHAVEDAGGDRAAAAAALVDREHQARQNVRGELAGVHS